MVQLVTLGSLTNPDNDGSEKVTKRKKLGGGGGLLNFMRLFSLSQIAKCRGISLEVNS